MFYILKNKRGTEERLEAAILALIIVLMVIVALFIYVNRNFSIDIKQKEIIGKQLCMFIIDSKPGTTIEITPKSELFISYENFQIKVRKSTESISYTYPCYTENQIEIENKPEKNIININ